MANITITAANFLPSASATFNVNAAVAGETLVAGELVYLKAADGRYWKAVATSTAASTVVGFSANGAAAGQRVTIVTKDTATACGAVLPAIGAVLGLSATSAGKLCPIADVISGTNAYTLAVAQAVTTSTIRYDFSRPLAGLIDPV